MEHFQEQFNPRHIWKAILQFAWLEGRYASSDVVMTSSLSGNDHFIRLLHKLGVWNAMCAACTHSVTMCISVYVTCQPLGLYVEFPTG